MLEILHTTTCFVIAICGAIALHNYPRRIPFYDFISWWLVSVGAFAHGVLRPPPEVDVPHIMLTLGITMLAVVRALPQLRKWIGDRRMLKTRDNSPCNL